MADLILLPTLERLRPYDDTTAGLTAFGLNFSVALGDGRTPETFAAADSFLKPWDWGVDSENAFRPINEVYLFSVDGVRSGPFAVEQNIDPDPGSAFRKALRDRYGEFKKAKAVWGWGKPETPISREARSWPAFVGQVSLYPYPLPQKVGLSCRLEGGVPEAQLPATDFVAVAPVLKLRHEGWDFVLRPVFKEKAETRVTFVYEVEQAVPVPPPGAQPPDPAAPPPPQPTSPPFSIQVETMACELAEPDSNGYFNFKDLWVRMRAEDVTNSEWRAGLEVRLAEQLHTARIVVDWLSQEVQKDPRPPLAEYPKIASIVLEQLIKIYGPGIRQGPEGSFLDRARFFGKETVPESIAITFKNEATAWWTAKADERSRIGWIREAVTGMPLEAKGAEKGSGLLDVAVRGGGKEERIRLLGALSLEQTVTELDQLLASLSNLDTLRGLFRIQWKAFIASENPKPSQAAVKLAEALANDLPKEIDLQRLLLLDNLGDYWREFKKIIGSQASLASKYKQDILEPLMVPGWTDELRASLAAEVAARVLPRSDEKIRKLDPGRTKGITFQLDTLGNDPGPADLLAHLQGLGVLMQRKGDTRWRCLNMAMAHVGDGNPEQVLLPTRLAYLNDVRSPTVTYDNGPLTAEGPMSPCAIAGVRFTEGFGATPCKEEPSGMDEPLVEFRYAKDAMIPGLVFGRTYRIVPFMVTNSGAIPQRLSQGNPWRLKEDITNADLPQGLKVQEETYYREMHVGSLRVQPQGAAALPPIPDRVAPRVRELSPKDVLPDEDPLFGDPKLLADTKRQVDPLVQTDSLLANTPLLLLAKNFPARTGMKVNDSFRFEVYPPTVDLQTWDRWVAGMKTPEFVEETGKNHRKFIWRSFYQLADEKGRSKGKLEDVDVYLDDPAVKGVWIELKALPLNPQAPKNAVWVPFTRKPFPSKEGEIAKDFSNWKTAACTLVTEQYKALPFSCSVEGDTLTVQVTSEGVAVPPLQAKGRLFRLSVYAGLHDGVEARFLGKKENVRTKDFTGTSPWHLLIETPLPLPENPAALQNELRIALRPDAESAKSGKLSVTLDLNPDDRLKELEKLRGLVYRAEIWHQVWHWRGRPPAKHPDLYPKESPGEFAMSEFGPRGDDEHRRLPMPRRAPKDEQEKKNKPEPVFLHEEDLDRQGPLGDRRALAHRFSARVFSRWEGILPEDLSYLETINPETQVRWKPHFVPCRHQGEVPAPKIKMVLPMTAGVSESVEDGPGLMVVVDGRWYEVGGLAERLGIEVMTVSDPEVPQGEEATADKLHFQIGTDPIVTPKSAGEAFDPKIPTLSPYRFTVEFSRVDGAIGHHRDHSQTDPRFLASSFLLSLPKICLDGAPKKVDLSWWFLKLRFRRELIVEGQIEPLTSEWSAPFWVQVLPGVERVEEDWLGEGPPDVRLDAHGLRVAGLLDPKKEPRNGFHLFAVITRKVIDFAGRPDQEAYMGVWAWDPASWAWTPEKSMKDLLESGTEKDLCIRFVEVQSKQAPSPEKLWDSIFKADQKDIERARIVRISNRYDVNGGTR